jgi:hypothetical protein
MTAVYLFQLVMLALLAVKKFVFTPLLLPLILFTFYVHRAAMKLFSRPWELLSLRDARRLDHADAEVSIADTNSGLKWSAWMMEKLWYYSRSEYRAFLGSCAALRSLAGLQ